MALSLSIDRTQRAAIYQQIAEQLREAISSGALPPGARLPTVRHLAGQLQVTRLTIQTAYAELQSAGWIEATVGRGTFVSTQVAPAAARPALDVITPAGVIGDILQMGQAPGVRSLASASPDPALFPADEFWACLDEQRQSASTIVGYGPGPGDAGLRLAIVDLLRERGVDALPDEVLITAGVTQGLMLAIHALAQPGDTVLVEQPTYLGFLHQMRMAGLQTVAVPLDAGGPDLAAFELILAERRPRFFYTIPTFQNPTGACATLTRRQAVAALARQYGCVLVEDDLYALVSYAGAAPQPLKALDGDNVIYVNSFSKAFMPGLRLGYLVAPAALHERLAGLRLAADLGSPLLTQRALASFLRNGGLRRHLRRALPVYRERRDALLDALATYMPAAATWTQPEGGFCTWLTLPRHHALQHVYRQALARGWAFAPGEVFLAAPDAGYHLRICFGSASPDVLRRGIRCLAEVIGDQMARPLPPVNVDGIPLV